MDRYKMHGDWTVVSKLGRKLRMEGAALQGRDCTDEHPSSAAEWGKGGVNGWAEERREE